MSAATSFDKLQCFVPWRSKNLPIDWVEEFGRDAPLQLEIGFGNGEYLAKTAAANPQDNHLGIEMTWGSIKRASGFCRRLGAENVRLIWEDARAALLWAFAERSLSGITALYPCPWPKKRHAKFRLFQPDFLKVCNSRLRDGSSMVIVTDSQDYKDQILETNTLEATGMESTLEVIPASFSTKYEKKWQDTGQEEFFRITFRKTQHRTIQEPETVTVKHHVAKAFDPEKFAPQDEKDPYSIQFKQFLYDPKKEIALQEVYTREGSVEQHFNIRIKKQENGWKIHPAGGPPLLPIPSVQRALDIVLENAEA